MKKQFSTYKPFLVFLGTFFICYLSLTFLYQTYLNQYDAGRNEVDGFTKIVASQSVFFMKFFNTNSFEQPNLEDASVKLFYKNTYLSRVVEGCNALSVMILFISFVLAFAGKFKPTLLFLIAGTGIIHFFNVLRIAILNVLIFNYPNQKHLLHGVVFPLIIYGIVFVLWIIWVNNFSSYAKKTISKQG